MQGLVARRERGHGGCARSARPGGCRGQLEGGDGSRSQKKEDGVGLGVSCSPRVIGRGPNAGWVTDGKILIAWRFAAAFTTSAASSESPTRMMPPTSPTSGSTPSSTAARNRRALPRSTARRCVSSGRWAMSPTSSTRRACSACPGARPSATCATPRREPRSSSTPSPSFSPPGAARWPLRTTATWSTPGRSGGASRRPDRSSRRPRTRRSSFT